MNDEVEFKLTDEDVECLESLSAEEIAKIDSWLLMHASSAWQKTAMLVIKAISESDKAGILEDVSDLVFGTRVEYLIEQGKIVVQGNVRKMRFSEIKLSN